MRFGDNARTSSPSIRMRPPVTTKSSGNNRMIASAVMLLPQPDSPTSAIVCPGCTENDRFSITGIKPPAPLRRLTLRLSTSSSALINPSGAGAG